MVPLNRQRAMSCIQPTSEMHLGNYYGAVEQWVTMQDTHDCLFGVVDLHAMTMPYLPAHLAENTSRMLTDLIACGIDSAKAKIFVQSLIPEHTELAWILGCKASYGELKRMTQFKEKGEQLEKLGPNDFISLGLLSYPVLQASDILVYRAEVVPVGQDQVQHLELTRNIARRFNRTFGKVFPEPSVLLTETPRIMSLADPDRKMSKSLGGRHYVGLFEEEKSVRQKVMAAVTDSGVLPAGTAMSPGVTNLLEILRASGQAEAAASFVKDFENGVKNYKSLKEAVADSLVELTTRLRANRKNVVGDIKSDVKKMSEAAREIARETIREVRKAVGLPKGLR
jgi:tryptophanyl-tRNA synthetase